MVVRCAFSPPLFPPPPQWYPPPKYKGLKPRGLEDPHDRRAAPRRRACTERECHTYTDTWCMCVCVYVSQSKRENHPVPQEGAWEIEWPYIHKDMVCVCVCMAKGKTILFHRGGGRQLENHKTAGGMSCSTGGRGEYTMTSSTY